MWRIHCALSFIMFAPTWALLSVPCSLYGLFPCIGKNTLNLFAPMIINIRDLDPIHPDPIKKIFMEANSTELYLAASQAY